MTSAPSSGFSSPDLLVARLGMLTPLSDGERHVLRLIERRSREAWRPDNRVLFDRSEIRAPRFILSGWACHMRELADARRQIMSVLLPGDIIGLCARVRPLSLTNVVALSPLRTVDAPEMVVAWRDRARVPGLSAALDLAVAEDEFFLLGHIMRLGRQNAYERLAHWLTEMEYRLSSRGLSADGSFHMPLTQEMLADVVGLSVVHVNRTLQKMRNEGRIQLAGGRLSILDRDALIKAGEFSAPVLSAPPPAPSVQHGAALETRLASAPSAHCFLG